MNGPDALSRYPRIESVFGVLGFGSGRMAAFFDRDGTVNVDKGYASDPAELEIVDGMPEFMAMWKRWGWLLIAVSNQSGIARGMYGEGDAERFNAELNRRLAERGAAFDAFYVCPHHPKFTGFCGCRKPAPGMLLRAAAEWRLDLSKCIMFGDKPSDLKAGRAAGAFSVLVTGGSAAWKRKA